MQPSAAPAVLGTRVSYYRLRDDRILERTVVAQRPSSPLAWYMVPNRRALFVVCKLFTDWLRRLWQPSTNGVHLLRRTCHTSSLVIDACAIARPFGSRRPSRTTAKLYDVHGGEKHARDGQTKSYLYYSEANPTPYCIHPGMQL